MRWMEWDKLVEDDNRRNKETTKDKTGELENFCFF